MTCDHIWEHRDSLGRDICIKCKQRAPTRKQQRRDLAQLQKRLADAAPDLLAVAQQSAEAIQHVREMASFWSDAQKQAFLNGVEQSCRAAIAKATKGEP
jgi:transcription elongation factor GreA-like protein